MGKIYADVTSALEGLTFDGMTVMSGGFGLCGIPENLIAALRDSGVIECVRAEPVHRLSREGDEAATADDVGGNG